MDTICYFCGEEPAAGSICGSCGFNFQTEELDKEKSLEEMSRVVEMRIQESEKLLMQADFRERAKRTIPSVEELVNVQAE